MNFEDFAFAGDLAALTLLASILGVDAFALALALRAHGLHLLDEAGTKLLDSHLDAGPTASGTFLHSPLFASTTYTHTPSSSPRL